MDEKKIIRDVPPKDYSVKEYILFKIDRSVALLGIIFLGIVSSMIDFPEKSQAPEIIRNAMALLGFYIGVRSAK